MPELPEVETIARGLSTRVTGDVIESVWLGSKPEILKSPASAIAATLESKRIAGVRRLGKHIVFDLESGGRASAPVKRKSPRKFSKASASTRDTAQWIVHLGMTGRMLVCKLDQVIEKHTHAIAKLASGRELRFVDPRRFGRLSVAHGFEAPGAEPLEIELDRFVELFRGRKTPIKSGLPYQELLRGDGNIYAYEPFVRAGIRPRRRAASLTRSELSRLYSPIQEVLKEAIALG